MAVKSSGTGSFLIPTAPAVGTTVQGGAANTFTTNAVQLIASTGAAIFITGLHVQLSSTSKPTYVVIRLSTGAGDGSIVGEFVVPYAYTAGATGTQMMGFVPIWPPITFAPNIQPSDIIVRESVPVNINVEPAPPAVNNISIEPAAPPVNNITVQPADVNIPKPVREIQRMDVARNGEKLITHTDTETKIEYEDVK
jgi:hypothetical protein